MDTLFKITASSNTAQWPLLAVILLLLVMTGLFSFIYFKGTAGAIRVTDQFLELQAPFYGRIIPLAEIQIDQARIVNLTRQTLFAPRLRTNGIGLPGFQLGWFKLRSGQRALAFLTDRTRVVYLPTTQDYVLLVSLQEAGQFISRLRAMRRDEN